MKEPRMGRSEAVRRAVALTPDQLAIALTYAHGFCPEALEGGLALEASTRPAPPPGDGGVLFPAGDDDDHIYRLACGCELPPTELGLADGTRAWCCEHGETVIEGIPASVAS